MLGEKYVVMLRLLRGHQRTGSEPKREDNNNERKKRKKKSPQGYFIF